MRQDCSDCFRRCLGRVEVALCMAFLYDRPPEARSKLGRASLKINGSAIRIRSARHGVTHELEEHFQVEDTRQGLTRLSQRALVVHAGSIHVAVQESARSIASQRDEKPDNDDGRNEGT